MTLLAVGTAHAQFTVEDDTKKKTAGEVNIQNQMQNMNVSTEYYSAAKAKQG